MNFGQLLTAVLTSAGINVTGEGDDYIITFKRNEGPTTLITGGITGFEADHSGLTFYFIYGGEKTHIKVHTDGEMKWLVPNGTEELVMRSSVRCIRV